MAASFGPAISADGRFVAFISDATNLVPGDTNGRYDVFVRDRQTGTTRRVSVGPGGVQGNGDSFDPAISADGRFVAFDSYATNLVPGDTNGDVRRLRPRPPDGHDPARERRAGRRPGQRRQRRPGDLGGRALRRLRLGRHQPGAGRHQRRDRRLCPHLGAVAA